MKGMEKPSLYALSQESDRISYLYLERCRISRQDNAITATDETGIVHIPAATISTLLLGPGTTITHRAIELISEAGVGIVWVGEHATRYYASGRSLSRSSAMLIRQARLVSNVRSHADVARRMYSMRFPEEDVSSMSIQQLRGKEGSRIRSLYRSLSKEWNVPWNGRDYDPNHFEEGDWVNQALSIGNSCLYGVAAAVISSLGCSNGLGFVHVGHELSFAYDIADLYKAELTIPVAFEIASNPPQKDFPGAVRRKIRDRMVQLHTLERMVRDIKFLLKDDPEEQDTTQDILYLWDEKKGRVASGRMYNEEDEPWEDYE